MMEKGFAAKLTFHLRFGTADLISKCRLLGLGDGLTGFDCYGIGGIEEKFGGLLNMASYYLHGHTKTGSCFYNVGFHVGGLLWSMANLCIQTLIYDGERAALQMAIHLRFGTADMFLSCRFGGFECQCDQARMKPHAPQDWWSLPLFGTTCCESHESHPAQLAQIEAY